MGEWTRIIDGKNGGTLRVTDTTSAAFGAAIVVPAGAFSGVLAFTIREVTDAAVPGETTRLGASISIEPSTFSATASVTVEIPFSRQKYNALQSAQRALTLIRHNRGRIEIPEGPIAIPTIGDHTPISAGTSTIIANQGAISASDKLLRVVLKVQPDKTMNLGTFTVTGS